MTGEEEGEEGGGEVQVITLVTLTFRVWGFRVQPTRTLSVQTLPKSYQRIQNVIFHLSQILSRSCPVLSWSLGYQVTRSPGHILSIPGQF